MAPSLNTILNKRVDDLILGLVAADTWDMFTTLDHTTPNYVRKSTCWGHSLNLAPMSVWMTGGTRGGNAISRRHILGARHFEPAIGYEIRFIGMDNTYFSTTVTNIAHSDVSYDISVWYLAAPLPVGFGFYQVPSADYFNYLLGIRRDFLVGTPYTGDGGIATLWRNQDSALFVGDFYLQEPEVVTSTPNINNVSQNTVNTQRGSFWRPTGARTGDSGSGMFLLAPDDGRIILWSILMGVTCGWDIAASISLINSLMTTAGGTEQLDVVDFDDFIFQGCVHGVDQCSNQVSLAQSAANTLVTSDEAC